MKTELKKSTKKQVSKKIAPKKATATLSNVQIEKKLKQLEKLKQEKKFLREFGDALKELKLIKAGKLEAKPIEYLLNEL